MSPTGTDALDWSRVDYDPTAEPDWGSAALDLGAYLTRLGVPAPTAPTLAALRALHTAHVRAIPFENLDVVLGAHPGLALPAVAAKLVGRHRGGYCFEHAPLFAAAAERLGFAVRRRLARTRPQGPGLRTHMMLVVTAEGGEHLADVGFGACLWEPMPLVDGAEVDQAGWPHRLVDLGGGRWLLLRRTEEGWTAQYEFEDVPTRPTDFDIAHHYTSTHPRSPFVGKAVVQRLSEGLSRRLVGRELTVEHADGPTETRPVAPEELGRVLAELDVDLTDAELAGVRARF